MIDPSSDESGFIGPNVILTAAKTTARALSFPRWKHKNIYSSTQAGNVRFTGYTNDSKE